MFAFADNYSHVGRALGGAAFAGFMAIWVIIAIAIFIFSIYIYWRIASKAGYNGALSLLMLVPVVNLLVLLLFAFSEWPLEQEVRRLRGGSAPMRGPIVTTP